MDIKPFESYHLEQFDVADKDAMNKLSRIMTDPSVRIESKQIVPGESAFNAETGELIKTPTVCLLGYYKTEEW